MKHYGVLLNELITNFYPSNQSRRNSLFFVAATLWLMRFSNQIDWVRFDQHKTHLHLVLCGQIESEILIQSTNLPKFTKQVVTTVTMKQNPPKMKVAISLQCLCFLEITISFSNRRVQYHCGMRIEAQSEAKTPRYLCSCGNVTKRRAKALRKTKRAKGTDQQTEGILGIASARLVSHQTSCPGIWHARTRSRLAHLIRNTSPRPRSEAIKRFTSATAAETI